MRLSRKTIARTSLALFLLVPFVLREIYSRAEPNPAVLLPSGVGKFKAASNEVTCGRLELLAVLPDGDERNVDPRRFFMPIPVHYWQFVAVHNRFGFGPEERRTISVGMWNVSAVTKRASSDEEKRETLSWIRGRLERFGIRDAVAIRMRRFLITYDVQEQIETSRTLDWEIDVELAE